MTKVKFDDHVIAHKFTSIPGCPWQDFMEKYDGERGLVVEVEERYVGVEFADADMYFFPFSAVEPVYSLEERRLFKLGEKVIARKFESTRYLAWTDSLEEFVGKPAVIGKEIDRTGDYALIFAGDIYRYFPASAVFPFEESPEVVEIKRDRIMPDGRHVTMKSTDGSHWSECDDSETVVTRRCFPLGGVPEPFVSPTRVERVIDLDDAITRGDRMGIDQPSCTYRGYEPPDENPHALAEWLRKPLTHGKGSR